MRPNYIPSVSCPICHTDDAVALATKDTYVVWCESGHVTVVSPDGGKLVHTFDK